MHVNFSGELVVCLKQYPNWVRGFRVGRKIGQHDYSILTSNTICT